MPTYGTNVPSEEHNSAFLKSKCTAAEVSYYHTKMISVYVFQSTHPRGVRLYAASVIAFFSKFQSTHPRGVRLHCRYSRNY